MEKIRVKMNSYTSIMVYLATFSIIIMIVILALCYNRIDLTIHGYEIYMIIENAFSNQHQKMEVY